MTSEAPHRIWAAQIGTATKGGQTFSIGHWITDETIGHPHSYILEAEVAKLVADAEARGMERAAEAEFPDSWRDDAHAAHAGGGLKEQRTWSAGFNACRNAIRAEAAAIRRAAEGE